MLTGPDTQRARRRAWIAMFITSLAVAAVTLVLFGIFGGFILLVALNGFSERQAYPIIITYFILVLAGCALFAALLNWLIIRRGFPAAGLRPRVALVPAAAASVGLLFVGPLIIVLIIRALG